MMCKSNPFLKMARTVRATPGARGVLSTGEFLAVALILNRADWIAEMGYTLADAIYRLDSNELNYVCLAARNLDNLDYL